VKIYLAGERQSFSSQESRGLGGSTESATASVWVKHVKRRLFSFFYHGYSGGSTKTVGARVMASGLTMEVDHAAHLKQELFLDSGAFTAFTKKLSIDIPEYADFVKKHAGIWEVMSSLDAIGRGEEAARKSYDNFCQLRRLGAQVQPVFHVREPNHWLQRYIDEGEPYILIGGMVPETSTWLKERLDELWSLVLSDKDGRAKVRTHGFGLTTQTLMFRYPWHSVDSTSWLATGIFGACLFRVGSSLKKVVFSDESPEARKYRGWHYKTLIPAARKKVDSWIEPFGVTAGQLSEHYSYRDVVNAATFQGLEDLAVDAFTYRQPALFDQ
jgi:hypothetical protein